MSQVEYYKGKLTPTGKTIEEFSPESRSLEDYYKSAVEIEGLVYTVDKVSCDAEDDIFESKKNDDGTISFEVKYYNGGCSFDDAISEAVKAL